METFSIELESRPDTYIAHLAGDASNAQSEKIHDALGKLADGSGRCVVIDLQELQFIASTTLAELIQLSQQLRESGSPLRICGAQAQIADVFEKTRLVDVFPMYDNIDAAMTAE